MCKNHPHPQHRKQSHIEYSLSCLIVVSERSERGGRGVVRLLVGAGYRGVGGRDEGKDSMHRLICLAERCYLQVARLICVCIGDRHMPMHMQRIPERVLFEAFSPAKQDT